MKPTIRTPVERDEYWTDERCHILEWSNDADDPAVSIARARVEAGVTTRWHRLVDTIERYVIIDGEGVVEIGDLPPRRVRAGDVAVIPARCRQRITNDTKRDLVFLAICTPRFEKGCYEDLESGRP